MIGRIRKGSTVTVPVLQDPGDPKTEVEMRCYTLAAAAERETRRQMLAQADFEAGRTTLTPERAGQMKNDELVEMVKSGILVALHNVEETGDRFEGDALIEYLQHECQAGAGHWILRTIEAGRVVSRSMGKDSASQPSSPSESPKAGSTQNNGSEAGSVTTA